MRKILRYLHPQIPRMIGGLSIKFTATIMDLLIPSILAFIIDDVAPQRNKPLIFLWGGVMLICAVIACIGNIAANRVAARVARNTTESLRHDLFEKITRLSCRQTDDVSIPSLISRLTSDTYNIHGMIGSMQRLGVRAPILLIGGICITLLLEPVLALVLIAMLPPMAAVVWYISKKGVPLYSMLQAKVDGLVRTVRENVVGIRIIKALSKTEYEKERFDTVNREVSGQEKKAGITMGITNPLMNLFLNLGLTLVIIVGAYRVNGGVSQVGKIMAFMNYFSIILNAMMSVSRMFVMYSKGSASAQRVAAVLDLPEDLSVAASDKIDTPYHVSFDHVCFSYLGSENNLTDISFALKKGETLGIIGATGSGKSTIINLLMRLYDAQDGSIRIDGEDVRAIPPEILHRKFGVVFQNDVLFADSIRENIDFGRELSDEQIEAAAKNAQAAEFIEHLPRRYQHMLTIRGTNLSGGQKQRLLISRALAAKPEILILDDSSSALDYKTDSLLREAIQRDFAETTTVIIAQRVSSIRYADHILVIEEGREIGYGTHEQLMQSCAVYREISQSQMGEEEPA